MTYEEFVKLVRAMRKHQRDWFAKKRVNDLREAKRLEKAVDELLTRDPRQGELFPRRTHS